MSNNDILFESGTPITWKASGGTYVITMAGLAAGAARQGAKGDLGAKRAARWSVRLAIDLEVAAVNGAPIELWWSSSASATAATDNTGGASGADAAYTGTAGGGLAARYLMQLIGVLPALADADAIDQVAEFVFYPLSRYGMPVVLNGTAQAFNDAETTHCITFTPLNEEVA